MFFLEHENHKMIELQKWICKVKVCIDTHPYLQYAAFQGDII